MLFPICWSYGWGVAGTLGFLASTVLVAVMYTTFVLSFTELTTAIPHAAGPFAYGRRALGRWGGFLAGFAALVEFLFAPPAIAFALGSYTHFIVPAVPVNVAAVVIFTGFALLNLLGVHQTARFELAVTIVAVAELLVFMALVGPSFSWERFATGGFEHGLPGVFAAIPYAIWFFLAIEGVAMTAEEVRNPARDIPIGAISGILTLLVLSFGVMFAAGGVGDWRRLATLDYPVPEALAMALGRDSPVVKTLAGLGLFGLVASLNGIVYSCSRQVYAMARAGFLPRPLARVSERSRAPWTAVLFTLAVGVVSILSGRTSDLITLSAIGAVFMYIVCMLALFVLRRREPTLPRPFRVPGYPVVPAMALVLSAVSLVAMVWFNPVIAAVFAGLLAAAAAAFAVAGPAAEDAA